MSVIDKHQKMFDTFIKDSMKIAEDNKTCEILYIDAMDKIKYLEAELKIYKDTKRKVVIDAGDSFDITIQREGVVIAEMTCNIERFHKQTHGWGKKDSFKPVVEVNYTMKNI